MESLKTCFGRRLKYLRKLKGYTQEQFSELIDINLRQLARIEAGESFVTVGTLQKICDALEMLPEELFKFSTVKNSKNAAFFKLIQKIEEISDDENKIEFLHMAVEALKKKTALEKLKLLIKGLELNI